MKKKLFQILMLFVATVSVGSFVSCKDTNEDLYNELRTQNMGLAATFEARVQALENLITLIESNQCDSTEILAWAHGEDAYLQAQIDNLNAALAALGTSGDYYTKDEIDRMRDILQNQINDIPLTYATLEDLYKLAAQVSSLEYLKDEVKTLREKLDKIKSCDCDCADIMSRLGALEADMAEVKAKANQALEGLKATDEIAKAAKTLAENAQKAADEAKTLAQQASADATAAKTLAETFKTLYETAANHATEAKVAAEAAKTLAESNQKRIASLEESVKNLSSEVSLATDAANDALDAAANAAAKADANKQLIDALTERVKANEVNIANLEEKVKAMETLAETVGANTEAIQTLKSEIEKYKNMAEELAALKQQVADCQETCKLNLEAAKAEIRLEVEQLKSELVDRISASEAEIKEHHEALKQIAEMIKDFASKEDVKMINTRLDSIEVAYKAADKALDSRLVTAETTIDDLKRIAATKAEVSELKTALEKSISNLATRITNAQTELNRISPLVDALTKDVKAIQDYLNSQITGIMIQGTHNPLFGSFSIPFDVQSNVIVAFYGKPSEAGKIVLKFPTYESADGAENYVRSGEALTDDDWRMITLPEAPIKKQIDQNPRKTLVNESEDGNAYAGKVYVTVNPTTTNVEGAQLEIVNSLDEPSFFKLSTLRKSNEELRFGYSRADNGFYEADAYIAKTDMDGVERPFDLDAIKSLAKEAKDQFKEIAKGKLDAGHTNLDGLATKFYEVIRSLRLDRTGLKCPFKDVNGKPQAVYSQYNLAATALKPLDLAWGKDFDYKTVPGYERAEKMLATIYDKLNGVVVSFNSNKEIQNLFRDLEGLNLKHVTLNELTDSYLAQFTFEIETSFTIDDVRYDLVLPVNVDVPVKYAEDLTAAGTSLSVAAANAVDLSYFAENIASSEKNALFNKLKGQVKKPTVVITNGDSGELTSVLVVPVNDQYATVQGFAKFPMDIPVALVSGEIQFDGTGIAMVSGSSLVTAGYIQNVNIDQLNYSFEFKGKTFNYYKKVDLSGAIKDLWFNQVGEAIGDVNDILDQLQKLVDDALKIRDLITKYEGKYTNAVENYFGPEGKLHGYLDKINDVIVNFVNGINWQLGPFIVAEDVNGFKVMSTTKSQPTVMTNNKLRLYPTSKTMEILCPFARKHIAVTNVFKGTASAQGNDYDCVKKLQAVNSDGDFNTVIDGTQRMIEVSGMVSGYTYEVAYSVLDFEGNIATRKTYIKIK